MAKLEARTARFTPGYKHSEEQEMADVDVVAQAVSAEATHLESPSFIIHAFSCAGVSLLSLRSP